ncbi:MAG: hypothetical protein H7837_04720 [Magnetococcus sp. MYC-9]
MKNNIVYRNSLLAIVCLFILSGCVSNISHRKGEPVSSSAPCTREMTERSIERLCLNDQDKQDYFFGFVEFDDQGWFHNEKQSRDVLRTLFEYQEKNEGTQYLIVTYTHGWMHNAAPDDESIEKFRNLLEKLTIEELKSVEEDHRTPRKVVGIYLAWRGRNNDIPWLGRLDFWNRKDAAERIGERSIKQFLTDMNEFRKFLNTSSRALAWYKASKELDRKQTMLGRQLGYMETVLRESLRARTSQVSTTYEQLGDVLAKIELTRQDSEQAKADVDRLSETALRSRTEKDKSDLSAAQTMLLNLQEKLEKQNGTRVSLLNQGRQELGSLVVAGNEFDRMLVDIGNQHREIGERRKKATELKEAYEQARRDGYSTGNRETQLVLIGHSLGSLIMYHALNSALLERARRVEIVVSPDDGKSSPYYDEAKGVGDLIVLVNPAFEGAAYEPILQATQSRCFDTEARINMLIITSETDGATGFFFPAARLDTYVTMDAVDSQPEQRSAILHAVGHMDRYRTHRLMLKDGKPDYIQDVNHISRPTPYWVALADPAIIDGHNDLANPNLNIAVQDIIASNLNRPNKEASGLRECRPFGLSGENCSCPSWTVTGPH